VINMDYWRILNISPNWYTSSHMNDNDARGPCIVGSLYNSIMN